MADFNQILTPGDVDGGVINVVVEIPEGSNQKIEWDRENAIMKLDRTEPSIFAKPTSYGFIPQTLDEDGDELDVLIVTAGSSPLPTGLVLEGKVLGVMKFEDDGEVDDKVVVRVADDRENGDWLNSIEDLGDAWKKRVEFHFNHYKDLKKPGSTIVKGWGDANEAKAVIRESIERWNRK